MPAITSKLSDTGINTERFTQLPDLSALITVQELAELAEITVSRIYQLMILPKPVVVIKRRKYYNRELCLRILDERRGKKHHLHMIKVNMFMKIARGDYDHPDAIRRHKLKKLASSYTKPVTTVVHLQANF